MQNYLAFFFLHVNFYFYFQNEKKGKIKYSLIRCHNGKGNIVFFGTPPQKPKL
jgi:prepilin-type processing-associated H-X9-DG protein